MMDAAPPISPFVIVEAAQDHSPQIFMGFTARGDDGSLKALVREAKALKIPAEPCPENQDIGIMVAFPPGQQRSRYLLFYRDALAGKFGKLKLELALLAVSKAQGGLDEAVAVDPDYIIAPVASGNDE